MVIEIDSGIILTNKQLQDHVKIYAGPGAGKTHFLVENIKSVAISNKSISESKLRKILCITYTNSAVKEIDNRLNRFSDSVEIFTIHGFIIEHIIKPFQSDLRRIIKEHFNIEIEEDKIISSQVEGLGILHGIDKDEIYEFITNEIDETVNFSYNKKNMGDIQVDISKFSNDNKIELSSPQKIDDNHKLPIKGFVWSQVGKLTHDEILFFGYQILKTNSTALYYLRVKFPFIFIDEFQDTNPLQTRLIKLIGMKSTTILVIGDRAQSIYIFQGAKPLEFLKFNVESEKQLQEYVINGNRRSTKNIVYFCNFLRKSDNTVVQEPINSSSDIIKNAASPITFFIGDSNTVMSQIIAIVDDGGVVLTRAWAGAFSYIKGIDDSQVDLLKKIYNSYYTSPIDIRAEITEYSNVNWVRAFRFIIQLYEAYKNNSFVEILKAFKLYINIDLKMINHSILMDIINIVNNTFIELSDNELIINIIEKFNSCIEQLPNNDLKKKIFGENFCVIIFDEYEIDNKTLKDNLSKLTWVTSYRLFTEVFSPNSRYMTVHQAKGMEWDKVIVSVNPNRYDEIKLDRLFADPKLLDEKKEDEFTRIYYVACSRAKENLYIHLPLDFDEKIIYSTMKDWNIEFNIVR